MFGSSRHNSEDIIVVQNLSPRLQQSIPVFFCKVRGNNILNFCYGLIRFIDIDGADSVVMKIVCDVRATVVDGKGQGQIRVGELLRPVVFSHRIFNGDVVSVVIKNVSLIRKAIDAAPKDIDLIAQCVLELCGELKPRTVTR